MSKRPKFDGLPPGFPDRNRTLPIALANEVKLSVSKPVIPPAPGCGITLKSNAIDEIRTLATLKTSRIGRLTGVPKPSGRRKMAASMLTK